MYFYEVFLNSHPKIFCFFFQAEDGIRDYMVTGVQTCALPISGPYEQRRRQRRSSARLAAPSIWSSASSMRMAAPTKIGVSRSVYEDDSVSRRSETSADRKSVV